MPSPLRESYDYVLPRKRVDIYVFRQNRFWQDWAGKSKELHFAQGLPRCPDERAGGAGAQLGRRQDDPARGVPNSGAARGCAAMLGLTQLSNYLLSNFEGLVLGCIEANFCM